jgi:hypothetical protein
MFNYVKRKLATTCTFSHTYKLLLKVIFTIKNFKQKNDTHTQTAKCNNGVDQNYVHFSSKLYLFATQSSKEIDVHPLVGG